MGKKMMWGKVDGKLLTLDKMTIGSSAWEAARVCARLAQHSGDMEGSADLEDWAQRMEALVADYGQDHSGAPFLNRMEAGVMKATYLDLGDCLAGALSIEAYKRKERQPMGRAGNRDESSFKEEMADALPESWKSQLWMIHYARRTKALIKAERNALTAPEYLKEFEASVDLAEAQAAASKVAELCKKMWVGRGKKGYSDTEQWALRLCMAMPGHFGDSRGFVAKGSAVEWTGEETRLAAQKTYAGYIPARRPGESGEGFLGTEGARGVDLAAAKLFDTEERAIKYFERMGYSQYCVVEVAVAVERVVKAKGSIPDSLSGALAAKESELLIEALERVGIEQLRARLAQLEALEVKGADNDGDAQPSPPRSRGRL